MPADCSYYNHLLSTVKRRFYRRPLAVADLLHWRARAYGRPTECWQIQASASVEKQNGARDAVRSAVLAFGGLWEDGGR